MKTFILLTFGFLGFAFYEMSGGAEFEPASARFAALEPETTAPVAVAETEQKAAPVVDTASITKITPTPEVTRVSLDLTTVAAAAEEAQQPERVATIVPSEETPQIILPSLIATSSQATDAAVSEDIRTVSGNRVNVRGGPSTDYGIVGKLTRGEEVRVIEDNGNGWVMIITPDTGEEGWMADFLLTSG